MVKKNTLVDPVVPFASFFSVAMGIAAPRIIVAQGSASRETVIAARAQNLQEAQEILRKAQARRDLLDSLYWQWLNKYQQLQPIEADIICVQSRARENFAQKMKEYFDEIQVAMRQQYAPACVCPSCGGEVEQTATSCEFCGQNLQSQESTPQTASPKESIDVASKAEVRETSKALYCEQCGAQADPGAKFCEACGTVLG